MTKKVKRFKEGGVSDKDRGLEASKDDKVSFFERLRMGNIDDEDSEAYRRFGAGRGRAESVSVEDRTPTPVIRESAKPASEDMSSMLAAGVEAGKRQPSGDASVAEMYQGPRITPVVTQQPKPGGKPSVSVAAPAKPAASKPKAEKEPTMQEQTYRRTSGDMGKRDPAYTRKGGATAEDRAAFPRVTPASNPNYSNEGRTSSGEAQSRKGTVEDIPRDTDLPTVKGERTSGSDLSRNIANTISALGPGKLAGIGAIGMEMRGAEAVRKAAQAKKAADISKEMKAGQAKTKFTSESKKPSKKTKKFDDSESNVEFKRGGKAYSSGGSVNTASKRADGIAQRGKTRGKVC